MTWTETNMAKSEKRKIARPTTVDCVVIRKNQVLLIKRINPPFVGRWALPGGFVNPKETIEQAALRELKEETGYNGKVEQFVGVFSDPKRDPRKTITVAFLVRITGGKIRTSNETSEVEWFPLNKLPDLAFDHKKIINAAIENL